MTKGNNAETRSPWGSDSIAVHLFSLSDVATNVLGIEVQSELSVLSTSSENLDISLLSRTLWAEGATGMCISFDLIKQTLTL